MMGMLGGLGGLGGLAGIGGLAGLAGLAGMAGGGGGGGALGMLTSPWIPRIIKLVGWIVWMAKNFFAWLLGFLSCYVVMLAWYGPKGILHDVAPQAGTSLTMMTATGCVVYVFEYCRTVMKAKLDKKVSASILLRSPDLD